MKTRPEAEDPELKKSKRVPSWAQETQPTRPVDPDDRPMPREARQSFNPELARPARPVRINPQEQVQPSTPGDGAPKRVEREPAANHPANTPHPTARPAASARQSIAAQHRRIVGKRAAHQADDHLPAEPIR